MASSVTISSRNRAIISGVMPIPASAFSGAAPGEFSSSSGTNGSWKKPMYQDRSSWSETSIALRNAAGCGTETAVSVCTRSGWLPAAAHATAAPQSCPTRCAEARPR